MTETPRESVQIAMFGQSGSGKTSLLASLIGNMSSDAFMKAHGYRFDVHNTADSNDNLIKFKRMEAGEFPHGTADFHEYRFSFRLDGLPDPAFDIVLYDYPGGWWESRATSPEEEATRVASRAKLGQAHVAIIFIDGLAYQQRGEAYLGELLASFKSMLGDFERAQSALPRRWLLAISKADALKVDGELPSLWALWELVHRQHGEALNELGRALQLGAQDGTPVRWPMLYLSAADVEGGVIRDAHVVLGADLIVPLALSALVQDAAAEARQSTAKSVLSSALSAIPWLNKGIKHVPGPLKIPIKLVASLGGLDLIAEVAERAQSHLEAERIALDKSRDSVQRVSAKLRALLLSPASRKLYVLPEQLNDRLDAPTSGPQHAYSITPESVLWRTRGAHFDYDFICKPDLIDAYGGWFEVWRKVFGGRQPSATPTYLLGSLNGVPYLATIFQDPERRDEFGRPIYHYLLWLVFEPLDPNPFATLQVPDRWGHQLVAAMSALPEVESLLASQHDGAALPARLRDADVKIDAMEAVRVQGALCRAEIVPLSEFGSLRLPSRADFKAASERLQKNQLREDVQRALIEGDTFAMFYHLGLTEGASIVTPRIRADQLRSVFNAQASDAALTKALVHSFQSDPADHFTRHHLQGIHERLTTWSQLIPQRPRPGFDALVEALRRHDKHLVLAAIQDPIDRLALLAGWIDDALVTDLFVERLLAALAPS